MPWVSKAPSPETQMIVDNFNTFRGGYLNSFGQMEFTVGRLLSRVNVTPPFEGSQDGVKFRFEGRMEAFELLLSQHSEFDRFKSQGLQLCERIRQTENLRNFFAHGIARFDADAQVFTLRRILPSRTDPWREVSIDIHAEEINSSTSQMSLLTQEFMYFARELSDTFKLEF